MKEGLCHDPGWIFFCQTNLKAYSIVPHTCQCGAEKVVAVTHILLEGFPLKKWFKVYKAKESTCSIKLFFEKDDGV